MVWKDQKGLSGIVISCITKPANRLTIPSLTEDSTEFLLEGRECKACLVPRAGCHPLQRAISGHDWEALICWERCLLSLEWLHSVTRVDSQHAAEQCWEGLVFAANRTFCPLFWSATQLKGFPIRILATSCSPASEQSASEADAASPFTC